MGKKRDKNANYNMDVKEVGRAKLLGQGDFANMPEKPIIKTFDMRKTYRDGILNNEFAGVKGINAIPDNYKG